MKDQEVIFRAGRDCVGTAPIVAELNKQGLVVKLLDDSAYLTAGETNAGEVRQQCHDIQR
jgi:hypothetical protein